MLPPLPPLPPAINPPRACATPQVLQAILFTPSFRWAAPIQAASCAGSLFVLRGLACVVEGSSTLSEAARSLCAAADGFKGALLGLGASVPVSVWVAAAPPAACSEKAVDLLLSLAASLA